MPKKKTFTNEQRADIRDIALHYGDCEIQLSQKYDLRGEELEELLLDEDVERCAGCLNFVECGELTSPIDGEVDGHCCNCRPIDMIEED